MEDEATSEDRRTRHELVEMARTKKLLVGILQTVVAPPQQGRLESFQIESRIAAEQI